MRATMRRVSTAILVLLISMAGTRTRAEVPSSDVCAAGSAVPDTLAHPGEIVLFGEFHGTRELPALFGEAVCALLHTRREVLVGLELPESEGPPVARFLESKGTESDRRALAGGAFWSRDYQDGRSSAAMLELLDRLRRLKRAGRSLSMVLFDAPPDAARDEHMAANISAASRAHPRAVVAVLTGNLHARTRPGVPWDAAWKPMGWFLAQHHEVQALDLAGPPGSYWGCPTVDASECGIQKFQPDQAMRARVGVSLLPETSPEGFVGVLSSASLTASGPAAGAR